MRNTFDQSNPLENKLTHALYFTLRHEPKLVVPFLKWIGVKLPVAGKAIKIVEQQIPGTLTVLCQIENAFAMLVGWRSGGNSWESIETRKSLPIQRMF